MMEIKWRLYKILLVLHVNLLSQPSVTVETAMTKSPLNTGTLHAAGWR